MSKERRRFRWELKARFCKLKKRKKKNEIDIIKSISIFSLVFAMICTSVLSNPVNAAENSKITPKVMYVNKYTFKPSSISSYRPYKRIGQASLDNTDSVVQTYLGF